MPNFEPHGSATKFEIVLAVGKLFERFFKVNFLNETLLLSIHSSLIDVSEQVKQLSQRRAQSTQYMSAECCILGCYATWL
jgi:hypothetical protein